MPPGEISDSAHPKDKTTGPHRTRLERIAERERHHLAIYRDERNRCDVVVCP